MAKHPAEVFGYPIWENLSYDLRRENEKYELFQTRIESSTIDHLFRAFRNNPNIPSKDDFIKRLEGKIQKKVQLQLHIE